MKRGALALLTVVIVCIALGAGAFGNDQPLVAMASVGSTFLETEAGITAYSRLNPVNLTQAARAFKYIERQTEAYIVGVVGLAGYGEGQDVHVYVDVDGWVAAYYLAQEPTSKIVDWLDYGGSIVPSKLEDALINVTSVIHQGLPYVDYYDFRYPAATKISIITDEALVTGTGTFNLLIPEAYTVYSRTWSHALHNDSSFTGTTGNIAIDGTVLNRGGNVNTGGTYWRIWNGSVPPSLLSADVWHEITVYNSCGQCGDQFVALVLIYAE